MPLNQQFTLAPGETAVIEGTGLRLQFVRVMGDSRCPADAFCIQGGDAIVLVRAVERTGTRDYDLHTGNSQPAAVDHGGMRIALAQLQPIHSQPHDPDIRIPRDARSERDTRGPPGLVLGAAIPREAAMTVQNSQAGRRATEAWRDDRQKMPRRNPVVEVPTPGRQLSKARPGIVSVSSDVVWLK